MRSFACFTLILCLLFAGCSRPLPPRDTLRVGLGAEPATLDPHLAQGLAEVRVLTAIYEGLVLPFPSKTGDVISGGVAHSWQVLENGCKIVFHLRSDAVWSNDTPVTAQDFVDSWQRALTPSLAAPNAWLFYAIEGAKDFHQGKIEWSRVGVKATSPTTLVIRLEHPTPTFLQTMTHPIFSPLFNAKNLPTQRGLVWSKPPGLITNGAFTLIEHKPYEKLTALKNPRYWGAQNVSLKKIEFYPIDNRSSEEMAFLSGILDVTLALPLSKVHAYRSDPRLRIDPALQTAYLMVNVRQPPLNDLRVRQALSLSLERSALCKQVLRAGQTPATTFVPPDLNTHLTDDNHDASANIPYALHEDLEEARSILNTLPAETRAQMNRLVLKFNTSEARKLISETLQAQWEKNLGLNITLENLEWKTFLSSRQKGEYDLAQAGWSADSADPSNFLELFVSDNPNNSTGWANAAYDRAVKDRQFAKAEAILLQELPCIPLYFNPNVYLISPRVHGWVPNAMDLHDWRALNVR